MGATTPKSALVTTAWSTIAALIFCSIFTFVSIVQARRDLLTIGYIVSLYLCYVALYGGTHFMEKMPMDSPKRRRFKVPAWLLVTTMNFLAAYGTTKGISFSPAALVWGIWGFVGLASAGLFWILILRDDNTGGGKSGSEI